MLKYNTIYLVLLPSLTRILDVSFNGRPLVFNSKIMTVSHNLFSVLESTAPYADLTVIVAGVCPDMSSPSIRILAPCVRVYRGVN